MQPRVDAALSSKTAHLSYFKKRETILALSFLVVVEVVTRALPHACRV